MGEIYIHRERENIKKTLQEIQRQISFSTNKNLRKLLTTRTDQHLEKHDENAIYQLECPTCSNKYTGETEGPFRTRFREYYDYRYANKRLKFAQRVIEEDQNYGTMNEIMIGVHIAKKGWMLDTLEKFHT
jgi:hypothetical protein